MAEEPQPEETRIPSFGLSLGEAHQQMIVVFSTSSIHCELRRGKTSALFELMDFGLDLNQKEKGGSSFATNAKPLSWPNESWKSWAVSPSYSVRFEGNWTDPITARWLNLFRSISITPTLSLDSKICIVSEFGCSQKPSW